MSMNRGRVLAFAASIGALGFAWGLTAGTSTHQPAATKSDRCYAVAWDMGTQAKRALEADGIPLDPQAMVEGFTDAILDRQPRVDPVTMRGLLVQLEREVATRQAQARLKTDPVFASLAASNAQRGEAALAAFRAQPETKQTANGVSYRVEHAGTGPIPGPEDTVVVSFFVQDSEGRQLAASSGQEIKPGLMIPGGGQLVMAMNAGSRVSFAIPAEQGFGLGGLPPEIGPNEALFGEVTLLEVR